MAEQRVQLPKGDGRAGSESQQNQVKVWLSRPGCENCEHILPTRISEVLHEPGVILWVDIRDPQPADMEMLREEFGFHGLALEDVVEQQQRAKVDEYPSYFFVVMHAPVSIEPHRPLKTAELDLFVGRNYVVTVHHGEVPALTAAVKRRERTEPDLRDEVGFLLHVITDTVIDSYFPIVEAIEDRLDKYEMSLFRGSARVSPEGLLAIKRSLYTLRKAIHPLREVFNTFLRRDQVIFSPETYPYFQDAYDHVLRLLDIIDIERDMATGALEAQLSVASNRLNETMRRLTVIAICVAVMSAIFGAWGMNSDEVPLHQLGVRGFAMLCGATLGLVGLVLILARRLGFW